MAVLRFFAVVLIFICVTVAWAVLGGSMWARTQMLDDKLSGEMASLWGPTRLVQPAPYIVPKPVTKDDPAGATDPAASTIDVDISHQRRYKGLLWYSTFAASLKGTYTVPAIPRPPRKGGLFAAPPPDRIDRLMFHLPLRITSHDGLAVLVDGKERPVPHSQKTSGTISVKLNRATSGNKAMTSLGLGSHFHASQMVYPYQQRMWLQVSDCHLAKRSPAPSNSTFLTKPWICSLSEATSFLTSSTSLRGIPLGLATAPGFDLTWIQSSSL